MEKVERNFSSIANAFSFTYYIWCSSSIQPL